MVPFAFSIAPTPWSVNGGAFHSETATGMLVVV